MKLQRLLTYIAFSFSRIMMSGLLLRFVVPLFTGLLHHTFTLLSELTSVRFGTWSSQCSFSNVTPIIIIIIIIMIFIIIANICLSNLVLLVILRMCAQTYNYG